ncbi:LysR family transcriptional regulator [Mesobacillus zeae]|uniref:LysR family transcriptional regulator n=1 Tax=Mesobacillus zeae TaxID=1917180 RepID=A0A398BGK1_9BACI|nr:LysR family transcriptional regulator [Mesobacillus zeae]RID86750.1 LysR family transcriptional regulator [Mesobacillus zeae]
MYYDSLKTFVTLAEIKNFTRTSELLHISQPSVSLHIKNLEKEFQTELFLRSPKAVQITPSGEILYNRAKQMIALYEQAKTDILEHHQSIRGKLRIGASFTIGEYILPSLLFRVHSEFPELELEVEIGNTEEIVHKVRSFTVDIGLIEGQTNEKELSIRPFMEDELFIVASNTHPLASRNNAAMSDLQNQAWVVREEGSGTREYLNHVIRSNALSVSSLLTISSNQGIKESVINGMGLSLLSRSVIEKELKYGELTAIPIKGKSFTRTFSYIQSPVMKNKRSVENFVRIIQGKYRF